MSRYQKAALARYREREAKRDRTGLGNADGPRAGNRYPDKALRTQILERDHYRCRYCGVQVTNEIANIDHVVAWPWGLTVTRNLVTACRPCNQAKGSRYVIPIGPL